MAGDLHGIKRALKEKSPRTAHESTQMIAALCSDKKEETSAYFGLGRKFGGKATRRVTLPRTKKNKRSKLSKVNGYWVRGKEHLARDHHSREEIEEAISKLKKGSYVSISDVVDVSIADGDEESEGSSSESD